MPVSHYRVAVQIDQGEFKTHTIVAGNKVEADAEAVRFLNEEFDLGDHSDTCNVRLVDEAGDDLWCPSMTIADLRKKASGKQHP